MADCATLIATLTSAADPSMLAELTRSADWLEVRADLVGDLDPAELRGHFGGKLLYTLRSRVEGGSFAGAEIDRRRRLIWAGSRYDAVDLEGARDGAPEVLAAVPQEKRVVSWHGPALDLERLTRRFQDLLALPAAVYKLIPEARDANEGAVPIALLGRLRRDDVVAFASGAAGSWTRLLAPRLGKPWVYGAAGETPGAPGQPSIKSLRRDFGLPSLPPVRRIYGIVGHPVAHSLSPRLHNSAYRELGLEALYLPFDVSVFGDFWLEVVESSLFGDMGLELGGLSVTAPHKGVAMAIAGAVSPLAQRASSANTLVVREGVWEAESTDAEGVLGPLEDLDAAVAGARTAVVGAGGAGRAAACGLQRAGAQVTLINRSVDTGRSAAEQLGVPFTALGDFHPEDFDLLVQATSLGRSENDDLPFDPRQVKDEAIVIDMVYGPDGVTALVAALRRRGVKAVSGLQVLLAQARRQFFLMTGRAMPEGLGRAVLGRDYEI